jgi:hypothetical protein
VFTHPSMCESPPTPTQTATTATQVQVPVPQLGSGPTSRTTPRDRPPSSARARSARATPSAAAAAGGGGLLLGCTAEDLAQASERQLLDSALPLLQVGCVQDRHHPLLVAHCFWLVPQGAS